MNLPFNRIAAERLIQSLTGGSEPELGSTVVFTEFGWIFSTLAATAEGNIPPVWVLVNGAQPHAALTHLQLKVLLVAEVDTASYHVKAEGTENGSTFTYDYDVNLAATGVSETHLVKDDLTLTLDPTDPAWFEVTELATLTITPYNEADGAQGTGAAGTAVEFNLLSPQELGIGTAVFDAADILRSGSGLELNSLFDVIVNGSTGNPSLEFAAAFDFGAKGANFTLDAANGCDQEGSITTDVDLTNISNLVRTEPFSIRVSLSTNTLTLNGTNFEGPVLTFTGTCAISFKDFGTGKIVAMGADY